MSKSSINNTIYSVRKNRVSKICFISLLLTVLTIQLAISQKTSKNPIIHDPVVIHDGTKYYLFGTGPGLEVHSSEDLITWEAEKAAFKHAPKWAKETVPGFNGHIWAPDIYFKNGTFYLYYSISSFGKNNSCIGLATNKTLDPDSPDYKWVDEGIIVESVPGRDLWNAIDPHIIADENGQEWMSFGSFWEGLKLVKLTNDLKSIDNENPGWKTISRRKRSFETHAADAGDAAVEAPFIFKKNDYYYLFVSFDFCCRGENSTYKVMVGRSKSLSGPYLDKEGTDMEFGGGSLVVEGNEDWFAVGHNSAYTFDGKDLLFMHGYDAHDDGKPKLIICEIKWDDEEWPVVKLD